MKAIPESHLLPCATPGKIERLDYGNKYFLLYTPIAPAERILYLIHGGGGDQHAFFCPAFLNMVDHMIARGEMAPLYIVSPCFYAPAEQDKTPPSSGVAVAKFPTELRNEIIPLAEAHAGRAFDRSQRFISGFSMGAVAGSSTGASSSAGSSAAGSSEDSSADASVFSVCAAAASSVM